MKKAEQAIINEKALQAINLIDKADSVIYRERLFHCNAEVLHLSNNCLALNSYGAFVALIDTVTGDFYDVLRYTYGYTATSAQHIAKFRNVFRGLITTEYRYYPI